MNENFDSSGSLPSGWTWGAAFSVTSSPTGGITPTSSPNVLACLATALNTTFFGVFGTPDSTSGNLTVSCNFNADSITNRLTFGLVARGSASSITASSGTYYWARLEEDNGSLNIYKVISGTLTTLSDGIGTVVWSEPEWYTASLTLSGSNLSLSVQRQSDGHWLNSGGTFQSSAAVAIATTDSSIAGSGYFGLTVQSRSQDAYADDFATSSLATIIYGSDSGSDSDLGIWGPLAVDSVAGIDRHWACAMGLDPWSESDLGIIAPPVAAAADMATESELASWQVNQYGTEPLVAASASWQASLDSDNPAELDIGFATVVIATEVSADDAILIPEIGMLTALDCGAATAFEAYRQSASLYATDAAVPLELGPSATIVLVVGLDRASAAESSTAFAFQDGYNVYANTGVGDPINYATPVATIVGFATTTWTSFELASPGTWKFGVRAQNEFGEEKNVDVQVTIILDANGNDITNRPLPPTGLRAFATKGGGIRVEWMYPPTSGPKAPTGFHVYAAQSGGMLDYGNPSATVPYSSGLFNAFVANLGGNVDGATYIIGVRAFNSTAEEQNLNTATVVADATGPAAVSNLAAVAIV